MEAHPRERGLLHVEEVKEDERFQHLAEVAWTHQSRDGAVAVPAGPKDDLSRPRLRGNGRFERASFSSHCELPSELQGCDFIA